MARRDEYESRVEKFLIPIMEENNFELVDVEYVKEAGSGHLVSESLYRQRGRLHGR